MSTTTSELSWTCSACRTTVLSPFCPQCGEEPLKPRDLSLRGVAYISGERKAWIAPFQLFLLANGLFFAIQSLTGLNVFVSTLDSHLHHQDWSAIAQSMVARRLALSQTTLEAYAPLFDRSVALYAKTPFAAARQRGVEPAAAGLRDLHRPRRAPGLC